MGFSPFLAQLRLRDACVSGITSGHLRVFLTKTLTQGFPKASATNLSWCSEKRVWSGHSSFWSGPLPSMRVSTLVLLRQGDHLPSCHLQWPQGHHSQLPPSWVPKRKTKWLSLSPCHEKFRLFCTITSVDSVHSTHLPDRSKLLNTGTLNLCAKTYTSGNTAKVQGQISSQVTVENGRHL